MAVTGVASAATQGGLAGLSVRRLGVETTIIGGLIFAGVYAGMAMLAWASMGAVSFLAGVVGHAPGNGRHWPSSRAPPIRTGRARRLRRQRLGLARGPRTDCAAHSLRHRPLGAAGVRRRLHAARRLAGWRAAKALRAARSPDA